MSEKLVFDPIKVMQGEDLNNARIDITLTFPKLGVPYYGPNIAKVI